MFSCLQATGICRWEMYNRVKLVLLCSASGLLVVILNFVLNNSTDIRHYSYLNVVQQSFNYNNEVDSEEPESMETTLMDSVLYGDNKTCQPVKKIIFAKTHKTGSTTVQNILYRFGEENQLLFVLPKSGVHYFKLRSTFSQIQADLYPQYDGVRYCILENYCSDFACWLVLYQT